MSDAEQAPVYMWAAEAGDGPGPEYGFVGRDPDIQAIEHTIGTDRNTLLVQGTAGVGKSTLLRHLARRWQRSGLVQRVFWFSYEDRPWTAEQIAREIRSHLVSPAENARTGSLSEVEQVPGLLRTTRHLLILDNCESISAAPDTIPHALDPGEREQLKSLLAQLRGGRSVILLGSQQAEAWLSADGSEITTYPLPGLDPPAVSILVDRILRQHHANAHLKNMAERIALQDLIRLLGGHPLLLTVVLPVLASLAPSALLAELQAGGEAVDTAGLIHRAVQYSHGTVDPALQISLQLLGPFIGVIPNGPLLRRYQDTLSKDDAVRELGPVDLAAALDQAVTLGLATLHPQLGHLVQAQPVLQWFLRRRLARELSVQSAARQAHYQHYAKLAPTLRGMLMSRDNPQERAAGQAAISAEYANLAAALDHGLHTGQPIESLLLALDAYLYRVKQHDTRAQLLATAISAYPEPCSENQHLEVATLRNLIGHIAYTQHRFDEAADHYRAALRAMQAAGNRQMQAVVYHRLGVLAQEQRRFSKAEASYQQALDIFLEFGDRHGAAGTHYQLGRVAQEQRRFAEAEASYQRALETYLEFGERCETADVYHQLGIMAQEQRRFTEAEASYQRALDNYLEIGDRNHAAFTYHQLGSTAQQQQRFAEAETRYRQALDIRRESDARAASSSSAMLGMTLANLGQHREAIRALLYAAVAWHQETGHWDSNILTWLHRVSTQVSPKVFTDLIQTGVPHEFASDLAAAVSQVTDPVSRWN